MVNNSTLRLPLLGFPHFPSLWKAGTTSQVALTAHLVPRPDAEGGTKSSLTVDAGRPMTYTRVDGSLAL